AEGREVGSTCLDDVADLRERYPCPLRAQFSAWGKSRKRTDPGIGSAIFPYQENDRPHRPKKENRPQDISSTFRHPVRVEMHWVNGNSISLRLSFLVVHLQTLDLWT